MTPSSEGLTPHSAGRQEVDLMRQADTEAWLSKARPDSIFLAAARVGGILANDTDQ
jgi:GDP-L-fucose synthase